MEKRREDYTSGGRLKEACGRCRLVERVYSPEEIKVIEAAAAKLRMTADDVMKMARDRVAVVKR